MRPISRTVIFRPFRAILLLNASQGWNPGLSRIAPSAFGATNRAKIFLNLAPFNPGLCFAGPSGQRPASTRRYFHLQPTTNFVTPSFGALNLQKTLILAPFHRLPAYVGPIRPVSANERERKKSGPSGDDAQWIKTTGWKLILHCASGLTRAILLAGFGAQGMANLSR